MIGHKSGIQMGIRMYYYLLALFTVVLGFFLSCLAKRIFYGTSGLFPVERTPMGLAFLFHCRHCVYIVPLTLAVLGKLSSHTAFLKSPIALASVAVMVLCIFFFGSLMLVTPIIALLPME